MDKFISQENIKRFKEQLKQADDEEQRKMLENLLESEQDHLAKLEGRSRKRGEPSAGRSAK